MKNIWKFALTVSFLTLLGTLTVFAQDTRKLGSFDEISATGDLTVILEKGTEEKAVVYAEGMSPDDVSIYIRRGELKVKLLNSLFKDQDDVKVVVTYKTLRSIRGHAGARVESDGTITGDKVEIRSTSGAHMELAVEMNAVEVNVSEGGLLYLSGKTETQDASVATGGQYEGLELACDRTYVKASTGGQAEVVAYIFLDANANTGGSIDYEGNPEEKNTRSLMSGGIRKI